MAKTKPPSQVHAFRKAARDLGADESETNFDAALKKVARHKPVADFMPTDDPESLVGLGKKKIQRD